MVGLLTVPNEARCGWTRETHTLSLMPCCPVSGNPWPGSKVEICYVAEKLILEVISLRAYIDSYKGGRGDVRSMEGMIQAIAQDAANAVQSHVTVKADLLISPEQRIFLECAANPQ